MQPSVANRPGKWIFHVSGFLIALVYAGLCWFSNQELPIAFPVFIGFCLSAFTLSLLAAWSAAIDSSVAFKHLFFWCVIFRAIAIAGEPIYEDDYYRYLWDGQQTVETGNPYLEPPSAAFDRELEPHWEEILDNINHPNIRTIYGPVNQYLFAVAYWVAPGEVWVLQTMFALFDLMLIAVLSRLARRPWVVLYGFSPLVLKEYSFTAHPDVVSMAALAGATLCWQRHRVYLCAVLLAVAVASKLFAFLLVPLLLRWQWRAWLIFLTLTVVLHAPFLDAATIEGLAAMSGDWLFNAPIYFVLLPWFDLSSIKLLLFIGFAALSARYFFFSAYWRSHQIPRADWLYLAMLLAIPAFNPWYFGFVLIYAVIYPSWWAWLGSASLLFSYATGLQLTAGELEPYQHPTWALWVQFLPLLGALMIAMLTAAGKRSRQ